MLIRLLKFEQLTFVNTTEETEALAEYFGFGNKWKKKTPGLFDSKFEILANIFCPRITYKCLLCLSVPPRARGA